MAEFRLPSSSIPTKKLIIEPNMMRKIMKTQKFYNKSDDFAQMFVNISVQEEASTISTEVSQKKGCSFGPHKTEPTRYIFKRLPYLQDDQKQVVKVKPKITKPLPKRIPQKLDYQPTVQVKIEVGQTNKSRRAVSDHLNYKDKEYYKLLKQSVPKYKGPIPNIKGTKLIDNLNLPDVEVSPKSQKINILRAQRQLNDILNKIKKKDMEVVIEEPSIPKIQNQSPMFVDDDRDRFGKYMFPLSSNHVITPGPGQYETNKEAIFQRSQKINEKKMHKRLVQAWQSQI
ncbi:hypothetical protein pb186bvf_002023 [Paramecium bursaria]